MEHLPSFDLKLPSVFPALNSSKELRVSENKIQEEMQTCEPVLLKELDYYPGKEKGTQLISI